MNEPCQNTECENNNRIYESNCGIISGRHLHLCRDYQPARKNKLKEIFATDIKNYMLSGVGDWANTLSEIIKRLPED